MRNLLLPILFLPIFVVAQCIPDDGCINGNGIYTWDDGTQYNGEWLNRQQHGSGIYSSKEYTYDGEWFEGKWHGFGVYTSTNGEKYEGNWLNGKQNGSGIYSCKDFTYDGELRDGKANGIGTQTWDNGDKYEGEWKDDKCHGNGIFTFISGNIKTGKWKENNLFDGFATVYSDKEGQAGLEIKYIYNNGNVVDTLYNSLNYFNFNDVIGDNISDTIRLIDRKTKYDIVLTINTLPVKWRFDTGAEATSINRDQWEKIKSKINYEDLNIIQKTSGIGGEAKGKLVKLKDGIIIGNYIVNNFIVNISDKHSLLGIDFLQKFSNVEWNMNEAHLIIYK